MEFTKIDCEDIKCQENCQRLLKQYPDFNTSDDDDFCFFHCRYKNCHDISLGKTSWPCSQCGLWMCQAHSRFVDSFDEYELEDGFCESCFRTWIVNKIINLCAKLKKYELQKQECVFKKDRRLKECNVDSCNEKNKLYKCETCKKCVCVDHLIDETGRIHCFLCFKKYLHDMQLRIDKLEKELLKK